MKAIRQIKSKVSPSSVQAKRGGTVKPQPRNGSMAHALSTLAEWTRWKTTFAVTSTREVKNCTAAATVIGGVMEARRQRSWSSIKRVDVAIRAHRSSAVSYVIGEHVVLGAGEPDHDGVREAVLVVRVRSGYRFFRVVQGFVAFLNGIAGAGVDRPKAVANAQAAFVRHERRLLETASCAGNAHVHQAQAAAKPKVRL